jgi:hypothetical protein
VHEELSKITRRDFGLNPENTQMRAAILNNRWEGTLSSNERWFFSEAAALEWLRSP